MKLLHITAHMGGGIGRTISGLVVNETENRHRVLCLQRPERDHFVRQCMEGGTQVICQPGPDQLAQAVGEADVCILHWWGHPAMAELLAHFPPIPTRCILWNHVNGLYYPWLSPLLLEPASRVFLTSPCSSDVEEWTTEQRQKLLLEKTDVVFGLGDLSKFIPVRKKRDPAAPIRVGYVGSFVKSKIHPQFVRICAWILGACPHIQFVLAGDPREYQWIADSARAMGIFDAFIFTGYVEDVPELLNSLDIFMYPLNKTHFATTENSILEAMAMELPVVLLNQSTERTIVTHQENGILAENTKDFAEWVCMLAEDPDLRFHLGWEARKSVISRRNLGDNIKNFLNGIYCAADQAKERLIWPDYANCEPWQWFLNSVRPDMALAFMEAKDGHWEPFQKLMNEMPVFREPSKGSVPHFSRTFPNDPVLSQWNAVINRMNNEG